jgi:hypothetical protein
MRAVARSIMQPMRPSGAVLLAAAALAAMPAAAAAEPPAVRRQPDEVDVAKLKPDMVVLHDGHGRYVALLPMREMAMTFYGDGRTFHQLRIFSSSTDASRGASSRRFWSPISTDADIILDEGQWTVHCSDRVTPMVSLGAKETRDILGRARFLKPFWKRQAHALARDDRGSYYYIDMIRDDRPPAERERDPNPPRGYRLYIGRKGRMKEQRLTDAVEDSKGLVLSIKGSDLSLDFDARTAVFSSDKSKAQLVYLPVEDNTMLIYRDLGLYRKLGVPCDDM